MQELYLIRLFFLELAAATIIFFKCLIIPKFMESWDKKIATFVEEISKEPDSLVSKKTKEYAMEQKYLIKKRSDEKSVNSLGFITKRVSFIELVIFILVMVITLSANEPIFNTMKTLGAFLGGWLAIKILTSHGPWSDKVVGKAYYHQSLIGTLLNVSAGLISGYFFFLAIFLPF